MSGRPRLVATDLDGTVVRADGSISQRTVTALTKVEEAGSTLVFVTGRPPRWLAPVVEATGHTGLAICANGAVLYDLHREQVVESFPLTIEVVRDIVRRLRDALPHVGFALESMSGFAHEPAYHPDVADPEATVQTVDELLADELTDDAAPVKLLARHGTLDADTLLAEAREVIGDVAELTHSSTTGLLEISAAGISKATTLARVCEERGIAAAEVVAFGDMPNDLPMLAWAGQAWAMGNAHPDVLAAVDQHTASNDDDGVALVLEKLFA